MRKKFPYAYFCLFFSLLAIMSLPHRSTEQLRSTAVALVAPSWKELLALKAFLASSTLSNKDEKLPTQEEEEKLQKLRLENHLLRNEIQYLKEMMQREMQLLNQFSNMQGGALPKEIPTLIKQRHQLEMKKLLLLQIQAIPGRVIFRSPNSWNDFLWIDIGEADNEHFKSTVIAKNSPVLVGDAVVGIIEYVSTHQSKVRLITHPELSPAVRVVRKEPNQESMLYLAKGEIRGSGKLGNILKGTGFNYDYPDEKGLARDLHTGLTSTAPRQSRAIPLIQVDDLLVTTGMDGIFPPDLSIGIVTSISPLKEGDYFYDLEATPAVKDLNQLSLVFVIPPISSAEEE